MIFSDELLSKAIARINELQNDIIQRADKIKGSKEYVEEQMKLFAQAEQHRKMLNSVVHQQEVKAERFTKERLMRDLL